MVGFMKSLTFFTYKDENKIRKEAIKTDWIMQN